MSNYLFRKATINDITFLARIIIEAEKSNSDKLSYSTLCNLSEETVERLIINMFKEEVDKCEFSVSSFLVVESNGQLVGGFGGWIESFGDELPSKILKSNLIVFTFSRESISFLNTKSYIIKDILIEREPMTLQLEYLFVSKEHRGRKITDHLIELHIKNALTELPHLKKIQVQVFKNNLGAIKAYENNGFKITKSFKSNEIEILNYLPFGEKYLMEKTIIN